MSDSLGFRPDVVEATVSGASGLLDFVSDELGRLKRASHLTALELIELGAVYVNDERILNSARSLRSTDRVRVHASPRRFALSRDLSKRIMSETQDAIVVEKPAGLPTEPTVDNFQENLLAALSSLRGQTFHLVHSLEMETPGLVIFAKTLEAQVRLKRAFADGTIRRTYAVYTVNSIPPDEHRGFVVLADESRSAMTDILTEGRTTWRIESGALEAYHRLEIELTSMRPAQLREGLARLGAVVIGDRKNGSSHVSIETESGKATPCLKMISMM